MKSAVVVNPAGTRLNLCAVLSQLDRHDAALAHAREGVAILQVAFATFLYFCCIFLGSLSSWNVLRDIGPPTLLHIRQSI